MIDDEDVFVVPPQVRRAMYAWRGATDGVAAPPAPKAGAPSYDGKWLRRSLGAAHSDPTIVAAARGFQNGTVDVDGAAGLIAGFGSSDLHAFLDQVRRDHGLVFAVDAVIRSTTIVAHGFWDRDFPDALRREPAQHISRELQAYLPRLRDALARCPQDEYDAAVAALLACDTGRAGRAVAAFLAPDSEPLVWAGLSLASGTDLLPAWVFRAEMLAEAPCAFTDRLTGSTPAVLRTAFVRFGPDVLDYFRGVAAQTPFKPIVALVIDLAAHLPTDAAAAFVIAEHARGTTALRTLVERFPRRTLRLLVASDRSLLARVVTQHVERVREVLDDLAAADRVVVAQLLDGIRLVAEAAPDVVPRVLVTPPWTAPRGPLPVIEGLEVADRPMQAGVVEVDAQTLAYYSRATDVRVATQRELERVLATGRVGWNLALVVGHWSADELRAALPHLDIAVDQQGVYALEMAAQLAAHKVGVDAYRFVVGVARISTAGFDPVLHFVGADLTAVIVDWLHVKGPRRELANRWLRRNGRVAAQYLVPTVLAADPTPRARALLALNVIAQHTDRDLLLAAVAAAFAPEVRDAVAEILERGPVALLPARVPAAPGWVNLPGLPQLLVADGGGAIPPGPATSLITMLRLSKPELACVGLQQVLGEVDRSSVAEFGRALLQQWLDAGAPSKDGWVLEALGWIGDDDTARGLAPLIARWPGEGQHKRAVTGLDVLGAIGTEQALLQLDRIARRVRFAALKERAQQRIRDIATQLGLSTEELSDRLVPDLGLDATGTLVLDFGARTFTVAFDENLRPGLADATGKPRKALPKPAAADDPELAAAAAKQFAALKKEARAAAGDQLERLRTALRHQRRWTTGEYRRYLVEHPLMVHLTRRLVWGVFPDADPSTAPSATFRLAEDRTCADATDTGTDVPEGAIIGLVHPLQLDTDTLAAWRSVFADYGIAQPFPQLARSSEPIDPTVLGSADLTLTTRGTLGLTRHGWERGGTYDGGVETDMSYPYGAGSVTIGLEPGIASGDPEALGELQIVTSVTVHPVDKVLPPVLIAELAADLQEARA